MSQTVAFSFEASFGGVALDIRSVQTTFTRRTDVYEPERGDGADVFDRGRALRVDRLSVTLPGTPDEVSARIRQLSALADNGDIRTFTHPIDGSWQARLGQFDLSIQNGDVTASMSILQVSALVATALNAENPDEETTAQDVAVDAERADAALADIDLDDVSVTEAVADAQSWDEETPVNLREDTLGAVRASLGGLQAQLDQLPAVTENVRASQVVMRTIASLQRFSDTLSAGGWRFATVTLGEPASLGVLLASVFGAGIVEEIIDQVRAVNQLRDATRIPMGTAVLLPTKASLGLAVTA